MGAVYPSTLPDRSSRCLSGDSHQRPLVVPALRVWVRLLDGAALAESTEVEGLDVDGLRTTLQDQLRHAHPDGRRDLEPRAAERRGEIEAVQAVDAPEDGVTVPGIAIERA